jgi:hypothetical protein
MTHTLNDLPSCNTSIALNHPVYWANSGIEHFLKIRWPDDGLQEEDGSLFSGVLLWL